MKYLLTLLLAVTTISLFAQNRYYERKVRSTYTPATMEEILYPYKVKADIERQKDIETAVKLMNLIMREGELIEAVETKESSWINGALYYKFMDKDFAIIVMNNKPYIFCFVPSWAWRAFVDKPGSWGELYHSYIKAYNCSPWP